ncbi:MAG TPA: DNA polymerase I, partial [Candidatus Jacksonbacteria bacterium]|nr:DNA polymerase I [Candidatus Jacksonbacteria bacterium]
MSQTSEKFMIIDGNALLHRAWHAIPQTMKAPNGVVTNAAYGFMMIFLKAIREIKPSAIAVCFDSKGKTFRDKLYKEYKAHREKKPRELYDQIPIIQELLDAFNIPYFQKTGVEADDLIGTLVKESRVKNKETKNIIVTGDMDTLQLVDSATSVYTLKKGVTKTVVYGPKEVRERYGGLFPEQLVDFKALRGDPSDNIPGARGIGEKTAIDLMRAFGSIDALYKQLDQTGEADIL